MNTLLVIVCVVTVIACIVLYSHSNDCSKKNMQLQEENTKLLAAENKRMSRGYQFEAEAQTLKRSAEKLKEETEEKCSKLLSEAELKQKSAQLKVEEIPFLARIFVELEAEKDASTAWVLANKKRPSLKGADEVKKLAREKKQILQELKSLQYKQEYYLQLVPWLEGLDDAEISSKEAEVFNPTTEHLDDAAGFWVTKEEYSKLSASERNQLALDRYKNRHKTNWEIGCDFERYCGYLYEIEGASVEYRGIIDGVEDKGRDLICRNKGKVYIVQCKYWSKKKTIHENHINQLLGTTLKYFLEMCPGADFNDFFDALKAKEIIPVFITSTNLSETAREFAKTLNITVKENVELGDYPMIKCNIGKGGEKIYHLPFDQQYDKVKMTKNKGEFYAYSVADAEKAGFRRAMHWIG